MTDKERNDYFYVCALIEYIARKTRNHRGDIVEAMGEEGVKKLLYDAEVDHCLSFEQVSDEVIEYYDRRLCKRRRRDKRINKNIYILYQ